MRRLLHLTLAALLLVSSVGFTVEYHYCMGRLVDSAVFGEPERCPMEALMSAKDKKGCCDDESERVELDEDRQLASDELTLVNSVVAVSPVSLALPVSLPLRPRPNVLAEGLYYRPPPLPGDFSVRYQVFRL